MRTFEPAARNYFRSTLQNKKITFCFVVFLLIRTFAKKNTDTLFNI